MADGEASTSDRLVLRPIADIVVFTLLALNAARFAMSELRADDVGIFWPLALAVFVAIGSSTIRMRVVVTPDVVVERSGWLSTRRFARETIEATGVARSRFMPVFDVTDVALYITGEGWVRLESTRKWVRRSTYGRRSRHQARQAAQVLGVPFIEAPRDTAQPAAGVLSP